MHFKPITSLTLSFLIFLSSAYAFEFKPDFTEDQLVALNDKFISDFNKKKSWSDFVENKVKFISEGNFKYLVNIAREADQQQLNVKFEQKGSLLLIENGNKIASFEFVDPIHGQFKLNHKSFTYTVSSSLDGLYDQILRSTNLETESQGDLHFINRAHAVYALLT
jgi:hypothetical protein